VEILSLLHPTPSSSSKNPNPIARSPTKLYYGGSLEQVGIIDSPYGYTSDQTLLSSCQSLTISSSMTF